VRDGYSQETSAIWSLQQPNELQLLCIRRNVDPVAIGQLYSALLCVVIKGRNFWPDPLPVSVVFTDWNARFNLAGRARSKNGEFHLKRLAQ